MQQEESSVNQDVNAASDSEFRHGMRRQNDPSTESSSSEDSDTNEEDESLTNRSPEGCRNRSVATGDDTQEGFSERIHVEHFLLKSNKGNGKLHNVRDSWKIKERKECRQNLIKNITKPLLEE